MPKRSSANGLTSAAAKPEVRTNWEPGREWQTVNAIHRTSLTMSEKSLLIVVAKNQSRRNGSCYASVETLALDMGCDVKTVREVRDRLAKRRIVEVIPNSGRSSTVIINWQILAAVT